MEAGITLPDNISAERARHSLEGNGSGGGHRFSGGGSAKTKFPRDWSDPTILDHASDVAQHPTSRKAINKGIKAIGERDGVTIAVIVSAEGKVITAYPIRKSRKP